MRFASSNDLDTIGLWVECDGWVILRISTNRVFTISNIYKYNLQPCYTSHSKKIKFIRTNQVHAYTTLFTTMVLL